MTLDEKNIRDLLDTLWSLDDSLKKAGGSIDAKELHSMSALALIAAMASNNVRFTHIEEKQSEKSL